MLPICLLLKCQEMRVVVLLEIVIVYGRMQTNFLGLPKTDFQSPCSSFVKRDGSAPYYLDICDDEMDFGFC